MARTKVTAKRKKSYQEPEENQDVYSSTESDYHEETQSEATSMNTISSSQPSKSSSPSITPKISKNSSSSAPSRRSSRIMFGAISSNKAPPQDNTIHVINSDDSETTLPAELAQQPPPAKSNSKTPTPKKETQSEATSMNTISSSQPSKSSSPSITPKISKNSSSSAPSRRSSRIMFGAISSNKAPPQDNTIHVINSDDSETTLPAELAQQPPPAKSNSKTPTPKKAKPSSPKPPSSSTKNSEITSLFDSAELTLLISNKEGSMLKKCLNSSAVPLFLKSMNHSTLV
uniref:Uncharacterized protein n=1 Tax=Cicer arietinum TaxID=3827 RepID=A0A1S2Y2J2_CICAR|nr:putative protein TPRXL [Cicer arietinum]